MGLDLEDLVRAPQVRQLPTPPTGDVMSSRCKTCVAAWAAPEDRPPDCRLASISVTRACLPSAPLPRQSTPSADRPITPVRDRVGVGVFRVTADRRVPLAPARSFVELPWVCDRIDSPRRRWVTPPPVSDPAVGQAARETDVRRRRRRRRACAASPVPAGVLRSCDERRSAALRLPRPAPVPPAVAARDLGLDPDPAPIGTWSILTVRWRSPGARSARIGW